jgi:hypothetical protein
VNSEDKPKKQRRKKAAGEGTRAEVEGKKRPASRNKPGKAQALVQAPADKVFWLRDGAPIANLGELRDALASGMSDEQFAHHVGPGRNDFASWVDQVLGNPDCARALREAVTRKDAARAVEANLAG